MNLDAYPRSALLRSSLGIVAALMLAVSVACSSGTSTPSSAATAVSSKSAKEQAAPTAASGVQSGSSELVVEVPKLGPVAERVRTLWKQTRPIIEADAKAGLSDEQYQARRGPMYEAWVSLQIANTSDASPSDAISEAIPRILELVDHVYGFPGSPQAERVKERQNAGRTQYLIDDVDGMVKGLP